MKTGTINKDINAWTVVSKWLAINKKRQSDLAILLNITASAVSQIKSGNILLNAKQIRLILDYLKIDSRDMCILYTLIFNARLNNKIDKAKKNKQNLIVNIADFNNKNDFPIYSNHKDSLRSVPLLTFKQAMNYEPALESIESFARCCSDQTVLFSNVQVGSFALLVDQKNITPEFTHSAILLVSGEEYPMPGDMVVAKLRTGEVITKYYLRKDNIVHLNSKNPNAANFIWHFQEDPGYIQWMYPIIEANLKLRASNFEFYD